MTRQKSSDWEKTLRQQGRLMQQWRENGPQTPTKQEAAENKRRWFCGLHGSGRITPRLERQGTDDKRHRNQAVARKDNG